MMKLRPEHECQYDVVSLGEVMLRLDPVDVPFEKARTAKIWHGGGETNVSEGLSYCFGKKSTILTGLVDDGIGRNIENQLREAGVDTTHITWFSTDAKGPFSTDAKGTLMNGINVTYRGKGVIPSKTEYYRAHTAVRELGPGDVDLDKIFVSEGVRWAHTGGIFTLLSPKTAELAVEFMKKAGEQGTLRSFDLNYRMAGRLCGYAPSRRQRLPEPETDRNPTPCSAFSGPNQLDRSSLRYPGRSNPSGHLKGKYRNHRPDRRWRLICLGCDCCDHGGQRL